jgi:nitrite reductase/ring-hydroxylating ferredoxin subunit/uncharacterized membrane protein
MRSAASIQGHPIHPMLISFPFAYLTVAFVFGLAGAISGRRELTAVSRHLIPAGIVTGLAAAVPGLIDYTRTVPPQSSASTRAAQHGLINSSALTLFAAAWFSGRDSRRQLLPLALQALGTAAISVGGWLGGTMVYRNQLGVDHRYAGAGKWNEQRADAAGVVALGRELEIDQMALVRASGQRLAVARTEQGYTAFQDRCTHRGGPLSDGTLICGTVQCPWHGSQFDVHTGAVKCGPAAEPIQTYPAEAIPGGVQVQTTALEPRRPRAG